MGANTSPFPFFKKIMFEFYMQLDYCDNYIYQHDYKITIIIIAKYCKRFNNSFIIFKLIIFFYFIDFDSIFRFCELKILQVSLRMVNTN